MYARANSLSNQELLVAYRAASAARYGAQRGKALYAQASPTSGLKAISTKSYLLHITLLALADTEPKGVKPCVRWYRELLVAYRTAGGQYRAQRSKALYIGQISTKSYLLRIALLALANTKSYEESIIHGPVEILL